MAELRQQEVLAAEVRVLQAMCTGTREGSVWKEAISRLARYRFRELVHQLIFEALRELNTDDPDVIRHELPVRLIWKGFPAVDTEKFLAPHNLSREEVVGSIEKLCERSRTNEIQEATPP